MLDTIWRHQKTGMDYVIRNFAVQENGVIPVVVYAQAGKPDALWVRPCYEFFDGRFKPFESGAKKPNFGPGLDSEDLELDREFLEQAAGKTTAAEQVARRDTQVVAG